MIKLSDTLEVSDSLKTSTTMRYIMLWPVMLLNIVLLNSENAFAATPLKGQVTLREKLGKAVFNAQITATLGDANPVNTDSVGNFRLEFLNKKPKDIVRFDCTFSDYEVVNKLDLEQKLPTDPDDHVVQIVMCPSETFFPCATAYYEKLFGEIIEYNRQKEREKIEQDYNDKLRNAEERLNDKDELVQTQKELLNAKNARIAELEEQNKGLQAQSAEWAKRYAKYDPANETDEMYAEALRLFQENKLDEAIAVLDDAKIQADLQHAKTQAANRYRLKAQSYVAKFNFANAEKYYQQAIDADPENFDNLHEFAVYLYKQNQFLKAQPLYEKALTLAKDDSEKARTLNNLGALYQMQNAYDKAADAYERALKIREELAAANPQTYRPDVAATLNNLGNLSWHQNEYEKAADAYERALNIYEELAAANPQTYRPDLGGTLDNLGLLYNDLNQYDKAAEFHERALEIREELAVTNPQTYRPDVATTLNNLGVLYNDLNQYDKAADFFERALKIREELAAANPQTYRPDVATTLNNLGVLYKDLNDYGKAANAYERALNIYEELAAANPQTYRPYVAATLQNLGALYNSLKEYEQAMVVFQRALTIKEDLAAENSQAYELDLCATLVSLSWLYQVRFESDPQSAYKTEGLALAERTIGILQKYPNIPRAQDYLELANRRKAFFEQAEE